MIFDMHQHYDYGGDIDTYAQGLREMRIRVGLSAGGVEFGQMGNTGVHDALKKHPDVIVGFYFVDFTKETPASIRKAHAAGFRGLKFIFPPKNYDDRSYYPIYRTAAELKMPCLFHTGTVARMDWVVEHFYLKFPEVKKAFEKTDYAAMDVDCSRMDPYRCDTIARAFPSLTVIMAHYGAGICGQHSRAIMQLNPNVYGDITVMAGDFTPKAVAQSKDHFVPLINEYVVEKLVFGTDNVVSIGAQHMKKSIRSVTGVLRALKIKQAQIDQIMGKRMNALMGFED